MTASEIMQESLPMPSLEPPLLGRNAKIATVAILMLLVGVVIVLWFTLVRPPEIAAGVGDATAPFVGILTAAALAAAIWSIHLQRHAITVQLQELQAQRTEMAASRAALEDQTKAQNELAKHQLRQLRDAELRELRSAYAHWFAEIHEWLGSSLRQGSSMRLELPGRAEEASTDGVRRLQTAMWQVVLLDISPARVVMVQQLSSPPGLPENAHGENGLDLKAIGAWMAENALTRFEQLEAFQAAVTNWFKTGEEQPLV